jgi:L-alanine-DL-glutamate epimerase-like enolase superfamily enzyme
VKIAEIEIFRYDLTYTHGVYSMSHGRSQASEPSLVVKISTDDGLIGWGETCPHGGTYLPGFFEGERAALTILGKAIIGLDPRALGFIQATMANTLSAGMGAKSAIDIACWDIAGQSSGLPVTILLGGRHQENFAIFEAVPVGTPESAGEYTVKAMERGTRIFQVKVGNDPLEDAARVAAVRSLIPDQYAVIADANGGWNVQQALIGAREMAGLRVYLEQPCKAASDCAEVRRRTHLPMIVDECVTTVDDLITAKTHVRAGGVNIKPGRVGGLTPAKLLRDIATEIGMMVTIDDTWGGALVTAASSHLAASTKPDSFLASSFMSEFTAPIIADCPRMQSDGNGASPSRPGLGVLVDEKHLSAPIERIVRS